LAFPDGLLNNPPFVGEIVYIMMVLGLEPRDIRMKMLEANKRA
jgi:hypothetical protein